MSFVNDRLRFGSLWNRRRAKLLNLLAFTLVNGSVYNGNPIGGDVSSFLPLQSSESLHFADAQHQLTSQANDNSNECRDDVHCTQRGDMHDASLFVPDTISDALRSDLATGLRAIADALDADQLDGKFVSANAAAGGRYDDRLHLRIVLDVAAPIIQSIAFTPSTLKLEN